MNEILSTDFLDHSATPIHDAIYSTDSSVVLKLIKDKKYDVNTTDDKGQTALHLVAGRGCLLLAEALIEQGAQVNALDYKNNTPLHNAIIEDEDSVVKLLLESGGFTKDCMHIAIESDNYEAVRLITPYLADIDEVCGVCSETHLYHAVFKDVNLADIFMENGADVNTRCSASRDTLLHAVLKSNADMEWVLGRVDYILDWSPNLFLKDSNGQTVLDCLSNKLLKCKVSVLTGTLVRIGALLLSHWSHQQVEQFFRSHQVNDVYAIFSEEVLAIKSLEIQGISLLKILTSDNKSLFGLLRNRAVREGIGSSLLDAPASLSKMLLNRLLLAKRAEKISRCVEFFDLIEPVLPYHIRDLVFSKLTNFDLDNLSIVLQ